MSQRAMQHIYPRQTVVVTSALILSAALLTAGLSLPVLYSQQLVFWKSHYSVWTGVVELWKSGDLALASVLFFFSMIFPYAKLITLGVVWFIRLDDQSRIALLRRLEMLGKWSMLDVFVVAILIVIVKIGALAKIEPRIGIYLFCAAIVSSMLTTMYVDYLARKALPAAKKT